MNLHGLAGLDAGARFVLKNGLTLRAHARALTSQLLEGLRKIEGVTVYAGEASARERVGVVSFNAGDLPSGPVADFQVRGGLHCAPGTHGYLGTLARGAVRASPGWQTQPDEIDAFLKTVDGIVRNGL